VPSSIGNWLPGTFIMALGLSTIFGNMFKKVDRFLNLNHCSTILHPKKADTDLESDAKSKVEVVESKVPNVISYATPTQIVVTPMRG
jgi:hypothetical protein